MRTSSRTEINAVIGWWDFGVIEMGLVGKGGSGAKKNVSAGGCNVNYICNATKRFGAYHLSVRRYGELSER